MKKYIADLLSFAETVLAIAVLLITFFRGKSDSVLWLFCLGEVCDALDGPCARRWPYPPGEKHWWRHRRIVELWEHSSDILLLVACALYLLMHANRTIRFLTLFLGSSIGFYCMMVEYEVHTLSYYLANPAITKRRILFRRKVYLAAIALGVLFLLLTTSYSPLCKFILACVGIAVGLILLAKKQNRLHEI